MQNGAVRRRLLPCPLGGQCPPPVAENVFGVSTCSQLARIHGLGLVHSPLLFAVVTDPLVTALGAMAESNGLPAVTSRCSVVAFADDLLAMTQKGSHLREQDGMVMTLMSHWSMEVNASELVLILLGGATLAAPLAIEGEDVPVSREAT
jgi:hypothetical protein